SLERIAAGRGDCLGDYKQPRPGNIAAFDRLFNADIAESGTFGFEVAQRGEALFKRPPHRYGRTGRSERQRVFEDIHVISALRRVLALKENVRVRVNQ